VCRSLLRPGSRQRHNGLRGGCRAVGASPCDSSQ
jgi:hypothetical protein